MASTVTQGLQDLRQAYDLYKKSYAQAKAPGGENYNLYLRCTKEYRDFKSIATMLLKEIPNPRTTQSRTILKILLNTKELRHDQKADEVAFNKRMGTAFFYGILPDTAVLSPTITPPPSPFSRPFSSSSLTIAPSRSLDSFPLTSPEQAAFIQTAKERHEAFTAALPEIKTVLKELYVRAEKMIDLDLKAVATLSPDKQKRAQLQADAIRKGYQSTKTFLKRLVSDVTVAYLEVSRRNISGEAQLTEVLQKAVGQALTSTGNALRRSLEPFVTDLLSAQDFIADVKNFPRSFAVEDQDITEIAKQKSVRRAAREFVKGSVASFETNLKAIFPTLVPYFPSEVPLISDPVVLARTRFVEEVKQKQAAFESELPETKAAFEEVLSVALERIMQEMGKALSGVDCAAHFAGIGHHARSADEILQTVKSAKSEIEAHADAVRKGYRMGEEIVRTLVSDVQSIYSSAVRGQISNEEQLNQALAAAAARAVQATQDAFEKDIVVEFKKSATTGREFTNLLMRFKESFFLSEESFAKIGKHKHVKTAAREFINIGVPVFVNILKEVFPMLSAHFPSDKS
jgi:hypothetical protein